MIKLFWSRFNEKSDVSDDDHCIKNLEKSVAELEKRSAKKSGTDV